MITMKKYKNRKIYRMDESRYTTLVEIISELKAGNDVEVIDHKTARDVTNEVLAEALTLLPVDTELLKNLIVEA